MREAVTVERLLILLGELGRRSKGPGRIYLVGGATALLLQIRPQTIDVDLKLDPEPAGVFEAIAELKNALQINIELAAPDDFLPPLPGWRERSEFIMRREQVDFFHYDFYGQCLAKLLRNNATDQIDVDWYVHSGRVRVDKLSEMVRAIQGSLIRYPAIDPDSFLRRVDEFLRRHRS